MTKKSKNTRELRAYIEVSPALVTHVLGLFAILGGSKQGWLWLRWMGRTLQVAWEHRGIVGWGSWTVPSIRGASSGWVAVPYRRFRALWSDSVVGIGVWTRGLAVHLDRTNIRLRTFIIPPPGCLDEAPEAWWSVDSPAFARALRALRPFARPKPYGIANNKAPLLVRDSHLTTRGVGSVATHPVYIEGEDPQFGVPEYAVPRLQRFLAISAHRPEVGTIPSGTVFRNGDGLRIMLPAPDAGPTHLPAPVPMAVAEVDLPVSSFRSAVTCLSAGAPKGDREFWLGGSQGTVAVTMASYLGGFCAAKIDDARMEDPLGVLPIALRYDFVLRVARGLKAKTLRVRVTGAKPGAVMFSDPESTVESVLLLELNHG